MLLYAVRKWPSCQPLKQNPNLGDWLADFPPHWLPPHHLLACLWGWEAGKHGLPVQSHTWSGYLLSWPVFVVWKALADLEEPSSVLSSQWRTFLHRQSPHWHEYSWPSNWISPDDTDSLLFSEAAQGHPLELFLRASPPRRHGAAHHQHIYSQTASLHSKEMELMQVPLHTLDCCSKLAVKFEAISHITKVLF